MPQESFAHNSEHELFQLGADVNTLCGLTPETFDPATHLPLMRSVIASLSPRIRASNSIIAERVKRKKSPRSIFSLATEHGAVSASEGGEKGENEIKRYGVKEYRIGNYVVIKKSLKKEVLIFTHFQEYNQSSKVSEEFPNNIHLYYNEGTNEPRLLAQNTPKTTNLNLGIGILRIARPTLIPIWHK